MAGAEISAEQTRTTPLSLGFQFWGEISPEEIAQATQIIFDHLYEGTMRPGLIRAGEGAVIAFADVAGERVLSPDNELTEDDIYARALIGTHFIYAEEPAPRWLAFHAENSAHLR